jgi:hypothetical protein
MVLHVPAREAAACGHGRHFDMVSSPMSPLSLRLVVAVVLLWGTSGAVDV